MARSQSKNNIVLIGLSGTGKSSVARYIASKSSRKLFDIDAIIEEQTGCSISEIFAKQGEANFRKIESEVLVRVAREDNAVIACGGGVVLNPKNMEILGESATIFCLWADLVELEKRIVRSQSRPLLQENVLAKLKKQFEERCNLYMQAKYHLQTDGWSISEIGDAILQIMDQPENCTHYTQMLRK